jgi:hypothetical protein
VPGNTVIIVPSSSMAFSTGILEIDESKPVRLVGTGC